MVQKQKNAHTMTVKKRLAISNLLMIIVPILITLLVGFIYIRLVWFSVQNGTGFGFQDSENFYKASQSILLLVENSLEEAPGSNPTANMSEVSGLLDKNAMALVIESAGQPLYTYGQTSPRDPDLVKALDGLGGQGFISHEGRELYAQETQIKGVPYKISVFSSPSKLSYGSLKIALAVLGLVLVLATVAAVLLTNRFLTRFVFQKIAEPLDILSKGVQEISEGNLDYRIIYDGDDEFTPICEDFNQMATRLKEAEESTRQHEKSRQELFAGISHDLRSPLTSIQAYVEGLLDGVAQTPQARENYLRIIKSKAEDIDRMLSRIFLFSKMDLGEFPDHPEAIQLDEEIRQLVRAIAPEYAEKGLQIQLGDLLPARIWADPDQLQRVLLNIIENSLKYKDKDPGILEITLSEENQNYILKLQDNGPGVPAQALPHLFEAFYRSDASRQNPQNGSGLGLAIVAGAVQKMQGRVEAASEENAGLTLRITLPKMEDGNAENLNH